MSRQQSYARPWTSSSALKLFAESSAIIARINSRGTSFEIIEQLVAARSLPIVPHRTVVLGQSKQSRDHHR
jgi:hypothetical protein